MRSVIRPAILKETSTRVSSRLPETSEMTPERIAQIEAHIAEFSLAGIGRYASPAAGNGTRRLRNTSLLHTTKRSTR